MSFWNRELPEVARRRLSETYVPRFRYRLLLFFVIFFVMFGAYVMAFVMDAEWGLRYGKWCLGLSGRLAELLQTLLGRIDHDGIRAIGQGFVQMLESDVAAVIVSGVVCAMGVVVLFSAVTWLRSFVRMLVGSDGSQAELFDETVEASFEHDMSERRRKPWQWKTDAQRNPYSQRSHA